MRKRIKYLIVMVTMYLLIVSPNSKAFFIGNDEYTQDEYKEAGVTWKHNKILFDDYYFSDCSITQELAEQITTLYRDLFKKEITDRTSEDKMYNLYLKVSQFIINISNRSSKETRLYQILYLNK